MLVLGTKTKVATVNKALADVAARLACVIGGIWTSRR